MKSIRLNPNISKYWEFGELKVLGYDTKSDMTSKYGTIFFIIISHLKWEDFGIEADRLLTASKIFPAETRSNNSGRYMYQSYLNVFLAGILSICVNFTVFSFVMAYNNKKIGAIFRCRITSCVQTQYL